MIYNNYIKKLLTLLIVFILLANFSFSEKQTSKDSKSKTEKVVNKKVKESSENKTSKNKTGKTGKSKSLKSETKDTKPKDKITKTKQSNKKVVKKTISKKTKDNPKNKVDKIQSYDKKITIKSVNKNGKTEDKNKVKNNKSNDKQIIIEPDNKKANNKTTESKTKKDNGNEVVTKENQSKTKKADKIESSKKINKPAANDKKVKTDIVQKSSKAVIAQDTIIPKKKVDSKVQKKQIKADVKDVPIIDKSGKKEAEQNATTVKEIEPDSARSDQFDEEEKAEVVTRKEKKSKKKSTFEILVSDTLSKGVYYKKVKMGNGKEKILIHVVEADLTNPNVNVAMFKGKENSSELEKLHDMVRKYNESTGENVLASVNGSFWKAFYNYPMGPTVIYGEVIELKAYKSWPSAFVDVDNRVYIDNFKLSSAISIKGKKYIVDMVNRRSDSSGICLYNKYVGDSVPYISRKMVAKAFEDALLDSAFRDITDKEFDTASFKSQLLQLEKDSSIELYMKKVIVQYIDKPIINRDIKCVVIGIADTGLVSVPGNGFVLTLGYDSPGLPVHEGDIITLKYSTDKHSKTEFKYAVCGTPRLIQSGKSLFDGPQKRNRSRFKWEDLPRTGIGTNKNGDKLYLIAASPTYKSIGIKGCTLENFAFAMKKLKIYNALNLDGGGSSVMLINNKNVLSCPECSRRLSIGVGISVKNNLSDK